MSGIKGQSEAARNARLDRACCPVHGLFMGQVSGWYYPDDEPPFTVVACGRRDCDVICKSLDVLGPVTLLTRAEAETLDALASFSFLGYLDARRSEK